MCHKIEECARVDDYCKTVNMNRETPDCFVPHPEHAEGSSLGEWKRVADELPVEGNHVQLYCPEIQYVGYYGGVNVGWVINAPGLPRPSRKITHWAPLRATPMTGEGEGRCLCDIDGQELPDKKGRPFDPPVCQHNIPISQGCKKCARGRQCG